MFYKFIYFIIKNFLRLLFRLRISGEDNIPQKGGIIIATNHISYWDPPLVACGIPVKRNVHFMAKAELFAIPVAGVLFPAWELSLCVAV